MVFSSFPPLSYVLIIAGLIFIFVALVVITGQLNIHVKNPKPVLFIGVILVVLGLVWEVTGITERVMANNETAISGSTLIPTSLPEIIITYPSDSATVQMKDNIAGIVKNIPDGQQLWIVIYPQTALKYYPQNLVDVQNDGSWVLPVQFGEAKDVGTKFDIVAVLAGKNAQKEFNNYIDACAKTTLWPGINTLPDGAEEYVRVTVTRV